MEDEAVFRALADNTRRRLLDFLYVRDGRTLTELESELPMTRFGVMNRLRVLEQVGWVTTRVEHGTGSFDDNQFQRGGHYDAKEGYRKIRHHCFRHGQQEGDGIHC